MEKRVNAGRTVVSFLLGGAMGAGAAFIMSKVCKSRHASVQPGPGIGNGEAPTPYCDVPEGADICFPKE